jgi:hypothetical protein
MENEFIPYEQALSLKELGFDESCFGYYNSEGLQPSDGFWWNRENKNSLFVEPEKTNDPKISAPTFSQVFRFFRDNFNLEPQVKSWKEKGGIIWHYSIQKIGEPSIFRSSDCAVDSHDEAQLICLQKLIELCKK